jgi:hypothetical protein
LNGGSVRRKAATYKHRPSQIQYKRTQTSMPPRGFKPTIVLERAKTVHALDRATAVIDQQFTRA